MSRIRSSRLLILASFSLLGLLLVFQLAGRAAPADPFKISNYTLANSKRLNSTVYEYAYRAQLTNNGPAVTHVAATLNTPLPTGITVVEGNLQFGEVAAGATVQSTDTFTVRHDRRYPFNADALTWTVTFDPTASNALPVANAGPDQTVRVGSTVTLDGSASTDADGNLLAFHWTLLEIPSGSKANLSDSTTIKPTFHTDVAGRYVAQLTVNDGKAESPAVTVTITATDQVTTQERLLPLGSYPDGLTLGERKQVIFTVTLVGEAGVTPLAVTLQLLDETGAVVVNNIAPMHDDGLDGDLSAGDFVYSSVITLNGDRKGKSFYRASAVMPGNRELVSSTYSFEVTPFKVGAQPSAPENYIKITGSEIEVIANELLVSFSGRADSNAIETAASSISGQVVGYSPTLGVYQLRFSGEKTTKNLIRAIKILSGNSDVTKIEPNVLLHTTSFPNDPLLRSQWNFEKIRADESILIDKGESPVNIAIIDSGIDASHPDLANKIIQGWDYIKAELITDFEGDAHGTHVAGIAGASSNDGQGIAGISSDSKILDLRVCDNLSRCPFWYGSLAIIAAANQGFKIISCSWGGLSFSDLKALLKLPPEYNYGHGLDSLKAAVKTAHEKGSLLVAAAGNKASNELFYPAAFPNVMAIGNTDPSDERAKMSTYGDWITMAAPGENICSTVSRGWGIESGTSMAAPHVSGAAAVLWALHPKWTADEVRERLIKTAEPLPHQQLGAGRLDLFEAVFNGSFEAGTTEEWLDLRKQTQIIGNWNTILPSHGKKFSSTPFTIRDTWSSLMSHKIYIPNGVSKLPIRFDWQIQGTSSCAITPLLYDPTQKKTIHSETDDNQAWGALVVGGPRTSVWNKYEGVFPISKDGTYYLIYRLGMDCTCDDDKGCNFLLDHIELKLGKDNSTSNGCTNRPPIANAGPDQGPDQALKIGNTDYFILDGSGSRDPDGDPLTYQWALIGKPTDSNPTLDNPNSIKPKFTPDKGGRYEFQLIVRDGRLYSEPDKVIITVNTPPKADAGKDQTSAIGSLVTLDGSGSKDPDGDPLTYQWSFVSLPTFSKATINAERTVKPNFTPDLAGKYVVKLIVNDGRADSDPDTVTISAE